MTAGSGVEGLDPSVDGWIWAGTAGVGCAEAGASRGVTAGFGVEGLDPGVDDWIRSGMAGVGCAAAGAGLAMVMVAGASPDPGVSGRVCGGLGGIQWRRPDLSGSGRAR